MKRTKIAVIVNTYGNFEAWVTQVRLFVGSNVDFYPIWEEDAGGGITVPVGHAEGRRYNAIINLSSNEQLYRHIMQFCPIDNNYVERH